MTGPMRQNARQAGSATCPRTPGAGTTATAGPATGPGGMCYADTPTGINREHALFDADRCVAANPSDTGPGYDITRMTILEPGDLLTAIRIPPDWAHARFYFEKVRDRPVATGRFWRCSRGTSPTPWRPSNWCSLRPG